MWGEGKENSCRDRNSSFQLPLAVPGSTSLQTLPRDKEHIRGCKGACLQPRERWVQAPASGWTRDGRRSSPWTLLPCWGLVGIQEQQEAGKQPAASYCLTAGCLIPSFRLLPELPGAPDPIGNVIGAERHHFYSRICVSEGMLKHLQTWRAEKSPFVA